MADENTSKPDVVPLRRLAEPPKRSARNNLARRLHKLFANDDTTVGLSEEAARFVADSVEEPERVRNEELARVVPVPMEAGVLHIVRANVCALRITPYMLNPRVAPLGRHPAAYSTGSEEASYWPPTDLENRETSELLLHAGTASRLGRTIDENEKALRSAAIGGHWRKSIRELGVRKPVLLMSIAAETDELTYGGLISAEGSTRTVELHNALGVHSKDVMLGEFAQLDRVHEVWAELAGVTRSSVDEVSADEVQRARCLFVPAELVVGFSPGQGALSDALESYLADVHINPQREWVEAAKNDKVGDRVLEHLHNVGVIGYETFRYLAGQLSAQEAKAAGFDSDPARRAAAVASYLLSPSNSEIGRAVGEGVRTVTGTDRARQEKKAAIVAVLAYRSVPDGSLTEQAAELSALERAFRDKGLRDGLAAEKPWRATDRSPARLRDTALAELEKGEPGPAALEMQALASFVLVRNRSLQRGRSKQKGGDPRDPQYVLSRATAEPEGIRFYYRVLEDHFAGKELTRPNLATGVAEPSPTGEPVPLREEFVRMTFRDPGEVVNGADSDSEAGGSTEATKASPSHELAESIRNLADRARQMSAALDELDSIAGDDGSLVDSEGIDDEIADEIVGLLTGALGRVTELKRIYEKRYAALEAESESDETEDEEKYSEDEDHE